MFFTYNPLNLLQQLVVKCVDISLDGNNIFSMNEITKSRLLNKTRCSHVLKYRGDGERITRKRVRPWNEDRPDEQRILNLYTEFAHYGDLHSIITAHKRAET